MVALLVGPDVEGEHRGHRARDHLVDVEAAASRVLHLKLREVERRNVEDEARSVDQRAGGGVVVRGREVAHAADQRALRELPDRTVAEGPVVRVLRRRDASEPGGDQQG